jgi:sulfatase modifying factor 1
MRLGRTTLSSLLTTGLISGCSFSQNDGVLGQQMLWIDPGEFDMGCTYGQANSCESDEKSVTHVRLTAGFWLGENEVTQGLYRAVTGNSPSSDKTCGDDCPVTDVSWNDAVAFCNALSAREGLRPAYVQRGGDWTWDRRADGYRLPTEAEWEYAARAGEDLRYSGSDRVDDVAWYNDNSGSSIHRVGTKAANAWGLRDMSGNVWEWTGDWYASTLPGGNVDNPAGPTAAGSVRVNRGGSYLYKALRARVSSRGRNDPSYTSGHLGFRVARGVPGPAPVYRRSSPATVQFTAKDLVDSISQSTLQGICQSIDGMLEAGGTPQMAEAALANGYQRQAGGPSESQVFAEFWSRCR